MNTQIIAETTYSQLGNQALYMMGAQHKSYNSEDGSISFKIRGSKAFSHIKIALNSLDLYDITFTKIRKYDVVKEETVSNVYADMMHEVIERKTGLYLSL